MQPDLNEDLIFQAPDVRITRTLAKLNAVSYPVNGIGSVRIERPNRLLPFLVTIGCLMFFATSFADPKITVQQAIVAAAIGFAAAAYGYRMPSTLILRTASGDQSAMKGSNSELEPVMLAIEKAVSARG